MTESLPKELLEKLQRYHQPQLVSRWHALEGVQRQRFQQQLESIQFESIFAAYQDHLQRAPSAEGQPTAASRAAPPHALIRRPTSPTEITQWNDATRQGEELLRLGKVAALVVAGGQGTRLGFDAPKGMFPIHPVSNKTLFHGYCEQLIARGGRAGRAIPYLIMTSDATHSETVRFFEDNRCLGLAPDTVHFFQQGNMPSLDVETGALLLASPSELALSPDGHGGLLRALQVSGLLNLLMDRGVEYLYYHQVDNPFALVCDPAYLGWHHLQAADVSTKVVPKSSAEEKMGVAVDLDGWTQIIEYSNLPREVAQLRTESGELLLWAGNTAMHVFSTRFLQKLISDQWEPPFHIAHKAVPYWSEQEGRVVTPRQPNAFKLERFIFDVLPRAEISLIVEADRQREFNPLKNAQGVNSPDDVKQALSDMHRDWLVSAGYRISEESQVEISPLVALEAADLLAEATQKRPPKQCEKGLLWE